MREEKRASRLWTPFMANRRYYLMLRWTRYATYAVTRRLVDVYRVKWTIRSLFAYYTHLFNARLGHPWDGCFIGIGIRGLIIYKFSSIMILYALRAALRVIQNRQKFYYPVMKLSVTTLELKLSTFRCIRESTKKINPLTESALLTKY